MAPKAKTGPPRARRAQGERTMRRLLEAGNDVLAERGYRATRVDDVVKRATTSHGTFYQYFASKDDLVRALARAAVDDIGVIIESLGDITPDDAGRAELRAFVGAFHDAYARHGAVVRAWAENQIDDRGLHRLGQQTFATMTEAMAERMRVAGTSLNGDADLAAVTLMATVERLTYFVTSRPLGLPVDGLLDELAGMLHRGYFGGVANGVPAGSLQARVSRRRAARSPRS